MTTKYITMYTIPSWHLNRAVYYECKTLHMS